MIRKLLGSFFALAVLLAIQASAQTIDELIKKNIDAHGGSQKLKAVKSLKATGKISQQGLEIPLTVVQKRPASLRAEVTFQGKTQVSAYDGETGWKIDPFQGTSEVETVAGDELKDLQEQSDMDGALVDYKDKGHTVELIGKEDMEGTPVYKLKLTLNNGGVRTIYLDAENYLELKVNSKRKTPGGEIEVDQYLGNYKTINGIVSAFSVETKVKGQIVNQVTIEKVEYDAAIDDALFKMPVKSQDKPKTDEKPKEKPPAGLAGGRRTPTNLIAGRLR